MFPSPLCTCVHIYTCVFMSLLFLCSRLLFWISPYTMLLLIFSSKSLSPSGLPQLSHLDLITSAFLLLKDSHEIVMMGLLYALLCYRTWLSYWTTAEILFLGACMFPVFLIFTNPGLLFILLLLFSHSVVSDSLVLHGLQHTRLACPSLSPRVCSNSCPLSWWCHPTIYPLSSPSPPTCSLSQHQGLF